MTPTQVINFYKKKANSDKITHIYAIIATDLNISVQTVYNWVRTGTLPEHAQIKLNQLSRGKLKL